MKTEYLSNITIAYMRNIGEYGANNQQFMDRFKAYMSNHQLLNDQSVILGIALDNPAFTPRHLLRYDIGLIVDHHSLLLDDINYRAIDDGHYAIVEVDHTEEAVIAFWNNLSNLFHSLPVDQQRPVIERYDAKLLKDHRCEFCIPILHSDN